MAKQRVTLEVLSYHATAPVEDASKLKVIFLKNWIVEYYIDKSIPNGVNQFNPFLGITVV